MIYLSNILSNNFLKFFFTIFISNIYCRVFIFFVNPNKISDFYEAIENVGKENYYLYYHSDSTPFYSLLNYLTNFFQPKDILIFFSSISLAIVINSLNKVINNKRLFYQRLFLLLIFPLTPVLLVSVLRFSLGQSIAISLLLTRNNNKNRLENIKNTVFYLFSFCIHPTVFFTYLIFLNPVKYFRIIFNYLKRYLWNLFEIIDSKLIKKKELLILSFMIVFLISIVFWENIILYEKIINFVIPYIEKFIRYVSVGLRFNELSLIFLFFLCIYTLYLNSYNFKNDPKYKSYLYGSFLSLGLYILNPIFWRYSILILILTLGYSKIIPRYFYFILLIFSTYLISRYFFF